MKIKIYLVPVISFCLLFTGCVSVGEQPFNTGTGTDLSRANFRMLKASARGTDSGFKLFCFLPLFSPSYADAMEDLHTEYDMEGKSTALVNVTHDKSEIFLLLFSVPRIKITADIIEFTE